MDKRHHRLWILAPDNSHQQVLDSWLDAPLPAHKPFSLSSGWQSNMDRSGYEQRFNRVHDYLLAG
ncbi:MAG TPA: aminodeoxychorismate synthase component I, partial [Idiomarina sp.]|nr:aminodeoxychorismate synthase component I [Idiomarina sp.]